MAKEPRRYLISKISEKVDWLDQSLQDIFSSSGYPSFNDSQSKVLMLVSQGVTKPSDIAKNMRISLPAIRHIAGQLIEQRILQMRVDPTDRRSRIITYTKHADPLRDFGHDALKDLEHEIARRMGKKRYRALLDALDVEWGETVRTRDDLPVRPKARRKRKAAMRARRR